MRLLIHNNAVVVKCPNCYGLLGPENKKHRIKPIKFPVQTSDILEETIDHMVKDWSTRCPHCNIALEITILT